MDILSQAVTKCPQSKKFTATAFEPLKQFQGSCLFYQYFLSRKPGFAYTLNFSICSKSALGKLETTALLKPHIKLYSVPNIKGWINFGPPTKLNIRVKDANPCNTVKDYNVTSNTTNLCFFIKYQSWSLSFLDAFEFGIFLPFGQLLGFRDLWIKLDTKINTVR